MLNKLLFASLLALTSSTSIADRANGPAPRPVSPRPAGCAVTQDATTELFTIDRKSNGQVKDYVETKLTIQSNGAWTYTQTQAGKVKRTEVGCLDKTQLATIKTSLSTATWKTSRAELRCTAEATDHFQYSALGKPVLRTEICDGQILDKATQQALSAITKITNGLVK